MVALVIVPLIFAIIGVLMYALASNPKLSEIGRLVFFSGFLVLTSVLATHAIKLP